MTSMQASSRTKQANTDMMLVRRSSPGKFSIHAAVGPYNAYFTRNANTFTNWDSGCDE
jgi:hypothetical protein